MNPYKVFILLATYNRAHLVTETLKSIQNQTYRDWECIIVDDYSTDNNEQIIKSFIASDPRFSFYPKVKKYSKGLSGSRNYGLDLAEQKGAQFIQFFDDDDIVHPLNLEISLKEVLKSNLSYCRFIRHAFRGEFHYNFDYSLDYKVSEINMSHLYEVITGDIRFNSCQVLWNLAVFKGERFDENLHYAEEWEIFQRILSKGIKGVSVDKVLYYARKHVESNTGEFWDGNSLRETSNIRAIKMVITQLSEKGLFTKKMQRHFFQLSVFYKDRSILNHLLKRLESRRDRIKYSVFYEIYPLMSFAYKQKLKMKSKLKGDSE